MTSFKDNSCSKIFAHIFNYLGQISRNNCSTSSRTFFKFLVLQPPTQLIQSRTGFEMPNSLPRRHWVWRQANQVHGEKE